MTAIGGPLESISLAGRNFACTGDVDVNIKLGGDSNEAAANGNGTARLLKTIMLPGAENVVVQVDDANGDHEYLQELANTSDFFAVVLTKASGVGYQGRAQIEELSTSSAQATASFNLVGTGTWTQQNG